MDVIYFPDDMRPSRWVQPVLALGNFDGLHRGHSKIIDRVRRGASESGGTAVVLTFEPHPPRIVRPDKAPRLLMTPTQKRDALATAGVQGMAVVRFTPELARWEPEVFVRRVLVEWLRVAEVWVGADFLFGRDRAGTFSLLRALGVQWGFRAEKIDAVRYKEFVVSSTRIRRLVAEGRVDEAGALLGHHYELDGTVVQGDQRGRLIGFPTANLASANEVVPPHGVYATLALLDGVARPAVTNIGVRPTFSEGSAASVETHVLDLPADHEPLYDRPMRVAFIQRLRDERRFGDIDALRAQIDADVRRARRLFAALAV